MKAPYKTLCRNNSLHVPSCGFCISRKGAQCTWEVGGVTYSCAHGSCYIVLTVKGPWLGLGVPNLALAT